MQYLIQFQIHIFALFILLIIYTYIRHDSHIQSLSKTLILYALFFSTIVIISEPLSFVFDGMQIEGAHLLEVLSNSIIILSAPVLIGLIISYVDYYIYSDRTRLRKKIYYMHFTIVTAILLLINLFFPIYFSIDSVTNKYSALQFYGIQNILIVITYLYLIFIILKNIKKIGTFQLFSLLLAISIPILGFIAQMINAGLFFTWTSSAACILFIYIFLESKSTEYDHLTGLYSRHSYEKYLKTLIEKGLSFKIMLLDLDEFKLINDINGHHVGDVILKQFSKILQNTFDSSKMISRLGGDEFIIIIEGLDSNPTEYINKLNNSLKQDKNILINGLHYSYGVQPFENGMSVDNLYKLVDYRMYEHKKNNLKLQRRATD